MDKLLIFGLFVKLLGYWLSWRFANTLKKNEKKKNEKKTSKSWWPTKKMYLSSVNLDVLTLQFANF
jgi:hypothetical protein